MESFEYYSFYRGVSASHDIKIPTIVTPRKDRRPKDTDPAIHQVADEWFYKKFGICFRSQGVFVTSCKFTARNYGATPDHLVRIIPLGGYEYCWSPSVKDMLFLLKNKQSIEVDGLLEQSSYQGTDLAEAYKSENELMLFCEKYIQIPVSMLEPPVAANSSGLILF